MRRAAAVLFLASAVACGGTGSPRGAVSAMDEMDQVRGAPAAREGAELAPQAHRHAELERELAVKAREAGDDSAAALHAERAIAAYHHAVVLARLARAERDIAAATTQLSEASEQALKLATSRTEVDRESEALEKQVRIA